MAENNGSNSILDDLLSGKITVEELRDQTKEAQSYLRAGKNYRRLTWKTFAKIVVDGQETTISVYEASEKTDAFGNKVAPKTRATSTTPRKKRGS